MKTKLGNQKIEAAQAKVKTYRLGDIPNLYLEIRPGKRCTHKHFVYRSMIQGQITEIRLGKYPELNLEEARALTRHYKLMCKQGLDPATETYGVEMGKCRHGRNHDTSQPGSKRTELAVLRNRIVQDPHGIGERRRAQPDEAAKLHRVKRQDNT